MRATGLCYGAQTWALNKSQVEELRVTQRAMERSILSIRKKDKITNENIRNRTNIRDIGYSIKKAKFKYAGHIMRGKDDRWEKRVTEWRPCEGKRGNRRLKTRWRDELERRVGTLWHREVYGRGKWREIGEAYLSVFGLLAVCSAEYHYYQKVPSMYIIIE